MAFFWSQYSRLISTVQGLSLITNCVSCIGFCIFLIPAGIMLMPCWSRWGSGGWKKPYMGTQLVTRRIPDTGEKYSCVIDCFGYYVICLFYHVESVILKQQRNCDAQNVWKCVKLNDGREMFYFFTNIILVVILIMLMHNVLSLKWWIFLFVCAYLIFVRFYNWFMAKTIDLA